MEPNNGAIIARGKTTIPLHTLEGVDDLFFKQVQMPGEQVLRKFKAIFDDTRDAVFSNVELNCVYLSWPIQSIETDTIFLKDFPPIVSARLTAQFEGATELGILGLTVAGYDKLEEQEENFMKQLFLDGWGTAIAECGYTQMRGRLSQEVEKHGIYPTSFWSPGQHGVDIKLQEPLFHILQPQDIGLTLNTSYMMHPKKSITGLFGISPEKPVKDARPCDLCPLRETCPSAYA